MGGYLFPDIFDSNGGVQNSEAHTETTKQSARRFPEPSGALLCRLFSFFGVQKYQWQPYAAKYP